MLLLSEEKVAEVFVLALSLNKFSLIIVLKTWFTTLTLFLNLLLLFSALVDAWATTWRRFIVTGWTGTSMPFLRVRFFIYFWFFLIGASRKSRVFLQYFLKFLILQIGFFLLFLWLLLLLSLFFILLMLLLICLFLLPVFLWLLFLLANLFRVRIAVWAGGMLVLFMWFFHVSVFWIC